MTPLAFLLQNGVDKSSPNGYNYTMNYFSRFRCRKSAPAAIIVLLVITWGIQACRSADTSGFDISGMEQLVFRMVNDYRVSQGLTELEWNAQVADLARDHSRDMAEGRIAFGHGNFAERVSTLSGLFRVQTVAENVGLTTNLDSPAQVVVDAWIANPSHKENIEDDFTITGVGVARDDSRDTWYYTQLFVKLRP